MKHGNGSLSIRRLSGTARRRLFFRRSEKLAPFALGEVAAVNAGTVVEEQREAVKIWEVFDLIVDFSCAHDDPP